MLDAVMSRLEANRDGAIERLKAFLAIPSVSTDPAYAQDVRAAAAWVAGRLSEAGLDPRVMETGGHPAVLATTRADQVADPGAPRVLFYGHYDVQPPDPVDRWTTPPFEPTIRDGQVYARGACDDKGQVLCFLEALRAWAEAGPSGKLPCHVTVLIEGEEECGSDHLADFVDRHRAELGADIALVSDTAMWAEGVPAIIYALRGLVYFDVKLHGPSKDLHSGVYGGTLANPATALVRVLGRLLDDDNRVTIPGFYDDVAPVSEMERQAWAGLGFSDPDYLDPVGARPFGEAGFDTLSRRWARPSCDINGLYGGYMGQGAKTVIPATAGAKVSFRIPAKMDPHKVARQFRQWIESHDVGGCRWELTELGHAQPVAAPVNSPWIAATREAVRTTAGREPVLVREGATIPVLAEFKARLGLDTLLLGFGLNSDDIHSPDEHFGLDRFHLGCRTHAALLAEFGRVGAAKDQAG